MDVALADAGHSRRRPHAHFAAHPDVGAIVLECTNMPPYATALQAERSAGPSTTSTRSSPGCTRGCGRAISARCRRSERAIERARRCGARAGAGAARARPVRGRAQRPALGDPQRCRRAGRRARLRPHPRASRRRHRHPAPARGPRRRAGVGGVHAHRVAPPRARHARADRHHPADAGGAPRRVPPRHRGRRHRSAPSALGRIASHHRRRGRRRAGEQPRAAARVARRRRAADDAVPQRHARLGRLRDRRARATAASVHSDARWCANSTASA